MVHRLPAASKTFVTCDAPVIITRPPNHSPLLGVGLSTPGSEKIIPLSSHVALVMGDQVARPMVAHITTSAMDQRGACARLRTMGRSRVLLESLLEATGVGGTRPSIRAELGGSS